MIAERLHAQNADLFLNQKRHNCLGEASKMGVHDIDRHLNGVEVEAVGVRDFQHPAMNQRVLVAGEADKADLAGLFRGNRGF